jgi:hypothetical protein
MNKYVWNVGGQWEGKTEEKHNFFHYKSHIVWSRIEPGTPRRQAGD